MTLVLLDDEAAPLVMTRVPQGEARREHRLRDLIFHNPDILPVHELDPGFGRIGAVTRELNVPGVGFIDVVLIDERGRLVIVECKLWRNPQARREVVGQILDYARELARFSYDDLQRGGIELDQATGQCPV
jgi:RecB family endonuclease NucS